jgi:hypothetical protein
MTRKQILFAAVVAVLVCGLSPLLESQMPEKQMPATSQPDKNQKSLDAEMMEHQSEMQSLFAKLDKSFQAAVDARDANGYVRDKSIVKAHEADLTELRNAVRNHKLFMVDYAGKCSVNSKQHDAMNQHQQQMKSVLYDVVDTFYTWMSADDHGIDVSEPVEDALTAHRAALKELEDAIGQHKEAMAQMMLKCA